LIRSGAVQTYLGRIRISRNGRFLVQHGSPNALPTPLTRSATLHDLQTGTVTDLGRLEGLAMRVADDGTVLTSAGWLVTPQTRNQTPLPAAAVAVDMDSGARLIVAQTTGRRRLFVSDRASGRFRQLGPDDRESYGASLSADGRWVLYLSVIGKTPQLFFSRPDGADWRQLTVSDEGVQQAALSGDGHVAFAVTGTGAVLRIDSSSGAAEQIIGPTPRDLNRSGAPTPGSTNILTGIGLAPQEATASPPLPAELSGTALTMAGVPMRLQSVSPERIVFQIPWEFPLPAEDAEPASLVLSTGDEYFETSIPVSPSALFAASMAVVHQDFSSLVTDENPALPGEIVHVYATGLGPVEPAVATGLAAPLAPLSRITTAWEFTWAVFSGAPVAADVRFAGLAPAFVGFYQLDIRVPSPAPEDTTLWAKHPSGFPFAFARISVAR
jgi:uncharacterized protein (TIGR03437 family)